MQGGRMNGLHAIRSLLIALALAEVKAQTKSRANAEEEGRKGAPPQGMEAEAAEKARRGGAGVGGEGEGGLEEEAVKMRVCRIGSNKPMRCFCILRIFSYC